MESLVAVIFIMEFALVAAAVPIPVVTFHCTGASQTLQQRRSTCETWLEGNEFRSRCPETDTHWHIWLGWVFIPVGSLTIFALTSMIFLSARKYYRRKKLTAASMAEKGWITNTNRLINQQPPVAYPTRPIIKKNTGNLAGNPRDLPASKKDIASSTDVEPPTSAASST